MLSFFRSIYSKWLWSFDLKNRFQRLGTKRGGICFDVTCTIKKSIPGALLMHSPCTVPIRPCRFCICIEGVHLPPNFYTILFLFITSCCPIVGKAPTHRCLDPILPCTRYRVAPTSRGIRKLAAVQTKTDEILHIFEVHT